MRIDGRHVMITVGASGLIGCLAAAVALAAPQSRMSPLSGLAGASEARAHALSVVNGATPQQLAVAASETRASLRQAPANATAWLRLAYLEGRIHGDLGQAGNLALARSYAVAPLGPDDTAWRLTFAFNRWTSLDRTNRSSVLKELQWANRSGRIEGQRLLGTVTDPAGRLALYLTLELGSGPD